jgi:glutamate synthase domain-containing protein 2
MGGDLVWQIGTGYFGCRNNQGFFDEQLFAQKIKSHEQIKMIEIKLSQGAKPGHGGILPAVKVTEEISKIRNVPMGKDVISPPGHSAFNTPLEFMDFIKKLRELSGGLPIGFKLCLGRPHEIFALCKAMIEKNIYPDFITIDGGEGGTGAAPVEFSNWVGWPLVDALQFIHQTLIGFNIRHRIKLIVSGKIITGFDIVSKLALGANLCNSARGMLFSIGCIQALRCHTNTCPAGVTTQNPWLKIGLVVEDKKQRVANYHHETLKSVHDLLCSMSLKSPDELRPFHLMRRVSNNTIQDYSEIFPPIDFGSYLKGEFPSNMEKYFYQGVPESFDPKIVVTMKKAA